MAVAARQAGDQRGQWLGQAMLITLVLDQQHLAHTADSGACLGHGTAIVPCYEQMRFT